MDAVGTVDIGHAGRPEHDGIPVGPANVGMRRRVGVVIGLDFHDPPADPVNQQGGADQFGRNLMDGAVEKASP